MAKIKELGENRETVPRKTSRAAAAAEEKRREESWNQARNARTRIDLHLLSLPPVSPDSELLAAAGCTPHLYVTVPYTRTSPRSQLLLALLARLGPIYEVLSLRCHYSS